MEYRELVDVYQQLKDTSSSIEKTEILAAAFREADDGHLSVLVKLCRGQLFADWESEELGVSTSLTKDAIAKSTGVDGGQIEDWWRETGDLGSAAAEAVDARKQATLVTDELTVKQVFETLQALATYEGEGSQQRRIDAIAELLSNADPLEAQYIVRTVTGAMRLGVGEGTVRDAIAVAFLDGSDEAIEAVERGHQVTNDFAAVAETARESRATGLADLDVELFRPIKAMLAQKAEDLDHGFADIAPRRDAVLLEYKYDGIRTQIHHGDDRTEVYTRRLESVTTQFPEVADATATVIDADEFIIEGEIVGYDPDTGWPIPFQELSQRVKRKYGIAEMQNEIPVTVHLFDLLYCDGESYLDRSLQHRLDTLDAVVESDPEVMDRAANIVNPTDEESQSFYEDALSAGHEGMMLKNLEAAYQPGSRVGYMMKLKPTMEPLDLVIVRAKWSEGRRSDFLGRVYLACRDDETGEFLEVGRMATGFTDEDLAEVTDRLEPVIEEQDGREVTVAPEVVVEVEYEEIQESPEYDSGYALRFPRFQGFRDDIGPSDVDTLARVESLYKSQ